MFAGSAGSRIHCDDADELIERGVPGWIPCAASAPRSAAFCVAKDGAVRMICGSAPPGTLRTTLVVSGETALKSVPEDAAQALADVAELRGVEGDARRPAPREARGARRS